MSWYEEEVYTWLQRNLELGKTRNQLDIPLVSKSPERLLIKKTALEKAMCRATLVVEWMQEMSVLLPPLGRLIVGLADL